jgi:hypothetical protein
MGVFHNIKIIPLKTHIVCAKIIQEHKNYCLEFQLDAKVIAKKN